MSHPPGVAYYVAGGTMSPEAASYIVRDADDELLRALSSGEFCYVLTPRQMGKSSLMVRTKQRLQAAGVCSAVIDLTRIGSNVTPGQWYLGQLSILAAQFQMEEEVEAHWRQSSLGFAQRWMHALTELVVPRISQPLVIFVDEIDFVRSLPFSTHEFFTGIRACYNRRAESPQLNRLTFCALGVATPHDLVQDVRATPFNIGRRIELSDFTLAECQPLASRFQARPEIARKCLERIWYWTNGHPYLTQRLCQDVAAISNITKLTQVDRCCAELFFGPDRSRKDDHLGIVGQRLLLSAEAQATLPDERESALAAVLDLYSRIHRGKIVADEPGPLTAVLKLSGLVTGRAERLVVRNRIYQRVFDARWVRDNLPGSERRRQRRAFRRGMMRAAVVAALILMFLGGFGFWYWSKWLRVHDDYYERVVRRYGLPVGIGPVSVEATRHRNETYRLQRKGTKILALEIVNAYGRRTGGDWEEYLEDPRDQSLLSKHLKPCRWEFVTDAEQRLLYEIATDCRDARVYALAFAPTTEPEARHVRAYYSDPRGMPELRGRSTAIYVDIERDAQGFDERVRFYDLANAPAAQAKAYFGRRYARNARGLVTRSWYLDAEGDEFEWHDGCVGLAYVYDSAGRMIEHIEADHTGAPNRYHDGSGHDRREYDAWGRELLRTQLGLDGKPSRTKAGWSQQQWRYDESGNQVELAYLDEEGEPVRNRDGYCRLVSEFDEMGRDIKISLLDEKGDPTWHSDGYHICYKRFDEDDNVTELRYAGFDGRPIVRKDSYAIARHAYDERGFQIRTEYFGLEEQPVLHAEGYARIKRQFDRRGRQLSESYFGPEGAPAKHQKGYHQWKVKLDERGNRVSLNFLDEFDRPASHEDGYATINMAYDPVGNTMEIRYLGVDGKPVMHKVDGRAGYRDFFDGGKSIGEESFGKDNEYIKDRWGTMKWVRERQKPGLGYVDRYYATKSEVAKKTPGTIFQIRLDSFGNQVESSTFDGDQEFAISILTAGINTWRKEFDNYGRETMSEYLEQKGRSTLGSKGYATKKSSYDRWGRLIRESFWGSEGRPIEYDFNEHHLRIVEYDNQGHSIREALFDVDGKLYDSSAEGIAVQLKKYNLNGRLVEERGLDRDERPSLGRRKWYRRVREYDKSGREITEAYFGLNGEPIFVDGWAVRSTEYDLRGRPKTRRWQRDDGEASTRGVARAEFEYDAGGHQTRESFFDTAGAPIAGPDGYVASERTFNAQGKVSRLKRVAPVYENVELIRTEIYNEEGDLAETRFSRLGGPGQPEDGPDGFATETFTFDTERRPVSVIRLDVHGNLAKVSPRLASVARWKREHGENGYVEQRFNASDKLTFVGNFNTNEDEAMLREPYSGISLDWTEEGRPWRISFHQPGGKSALYNAGYSTVELRYDSHQRLVGERYFLPGHRPAIIREDGVPWFLRIPFAADALAPEEIETAPVPMEAPILVPEDAFAPAAANAPAPVPEEAPAPVPADAPAPVPEDPPSPADAPAPAPADIFASAPADSAADEPLLDLVKLHLPADLIPIYADRDMATPGYFSRRERAFNDDNRIKLTAWYDADDRPTLIDEGYARVARTFRAGRLVEVAYFGYEKQPVNIRSGGYARMSQELDGDGNVLARTYYDNRQNLTVVNSNSGDSQSLPASCARYEARYSGHQLLSESFFDEKNALRETELGYARAEFAYDASGQLVQRAYFGQANQPLPIDLARDADRLWKLPGMPAPARVTGTKFNRPEWLPFRRSVAELLVQSTSIRESTESLLLDWIRDPEATDLQRSFEFMSLMHEASNKVNRSGTNSRFPFVLFWNPLGAKQLTCLGPPFDLFAATGIQELRFVRAEQMTSNLDTTASHVERLSGIVGVGDIDDIRLQFEGFVLNKVSLWKKGQLAVGPAGVAQARLRFSAESGEPETLELLDARDQLSNNRAGWAQLKRELPDLSKSGSGDEKLIRLDLNGKPASLVDGWSEIRRTRRGRALITSKIEKTDYYNAAHELLAAKLFVDEIKFGALTTASWLAENDVLDIDKDELWILRGGNRIKASTSGRFGEPAEIIFKCFVGSQRGAVDVLSDDVLFLSLPYRELLNKLLPNYNFDRTISGLLRFRSASKDERDLELVPAPRAVETSVPTTP